MDDTTIKTWITVCSLVLALINILKGVIGVIAAVRGALGRWNFRNA
jgi:hypothetical protein